MGNRKEKDILEIDFLEVIAICLKNWWLIVFVTAFFGVASFFATKNFVTPTYQSMVKIYVNNRNSTVGVTSVSSADLMASAQLVDVYDVILRTKDTLDTVIQEAGLDYDNNQVNGMISTSALNETQVFQVTVTSTSPKEAQLIASTIGEVLPGFISNVIDNVDARVVEHAIVPTYSSSPSYTKNTLKGAMLGFILILFIVVVREFMNISIKNEDDLVNIIGEVPVLTHIPNFDENSKKKNTYRNGYYASGKGDK